MRGLRHPWGRPPRRRLVGVSSESLRAGCGLVGVGSRVGDEGEEAETEVEEGEREDCCARRMRRARASSSSFKGSSSPRPPEYESSASVCRCRRRLLLRRAERSAAFGVAASRAACADLEVPLAFDGVEKERAGLFGGVLLVVTPDSVAFGDTLAVLRDDLRGVDVVG